jgi:hypothetical protein
MKMTLKAMTRIKQKSLLSLERNNEPTQPQGKRLYEMLLHERLLHERLLGPLHRRLYSPTQLPALGWRVPAYGPPRILM